MTRPIIGIPMGDPCGIGPEIVVKTFNEKDVYSYSKPLLIGDKAVIENAMKIVGITLEVNTIEDPMDGKYIHGTIDLMDLKNVDMNELQIGKVQAMAGKASFDYIKASVELAMDKKIHAIATTPINKEALRAGEIPYIGHTEILEDLSGSHDPLTMFEVRDLRVFFLTRHVSLRQACDLVTKERVLDYIIRCTEALKKLGVSGGTMAVAGLNPHSGEHGLFGNEEVDHVTPAIEEAQRMGYKVVGPVGADSVFHQALHGKYQAVLSLYHDQGHIATKTLDFERTIAITNGMPFLRTSVDHGTAFDIAGQGIASAVSMIEAVRLAAKYAVNFVK